MIQPVNQHLLIEPLKSDTFLAQQDDKYEQIGIVKRVPFFAKLKGVRINDRVYFDSWLAGKYRNPDGEEGDFYWFVNWKDIKAIEKAKKTDDGDGG